MQLGKLLVEKFHITSDDLARAESYQSRFGGRLDQILVNMGGLPDDQVPELYSEFLNIPMINLDDWEDSERVLIDSATSKLFIEKQWVPLEKKDSRWTFACRFPLELTINEWISQNDIEAKLFIASESDIQALSNKFGHQVDPENDELAVGDEEERLRELATEAPTVNLLNSLISRALRQGASDMHLEPFNGRYRARFRVDGVLHEAEILSPRMQLPIVTRLKILSGMDIAEKRRPQDGKIEMKIANQELDIRVSALPLNDGESMVLRFLRKDNVQYDMSVLVLCNDIESKIH